MTATVQRLDAHDPTLEPMLQLVAGDMEHVNTVIVDRMRSDIPLIPELAGHLIAGGGKRLRPMLTLASARLLGYEGTRHHVLAAAVDGDWVRVFTGFLWDDFYRFASLLVLPSAVLAGAGVRALVPLGSARRPAARTSSATRSRSSSPGIPIGADGIGAQASTRTTSAPSPASRSACERPWPRAAPVIRAILPSSRP